MRDIKLHALSLLAKMRASPQMWACTKEAFVAQVAIILDFTDEMASRDFYPIAFGQPRRSSTPIVAVAELTASFEDEWARSVVDKAEKLIRI